MAEKCIHLNHNCPNCKRHYRTEELVEVCSDCGTDLHCGNYPSYGSKYCINHGGAVPSRGYYGKGRAIVNGSASRFPISNLAAKYLELKTDGRYLSNIQSIDIIRERIQELARRIDVKEAPERLVRLRELWEEYKDYKRKEDHLMATATLNLIDKEFEAAYHDYMAWQQMMEALDLDRKMVESQVKIAKDLKAMLTAEDAYSLAAKLLAAIIDAASSLIVEDTTRAKFLRRIEYEFAKLIGDRSSREDQEGPGGSSGEIVDSVSSSVD